MSESGARPPLVAVLGVGVIGDPDTAVVRATDLGFTRGDGCFEATRVQTDLTGESTVDHLDAHLDRFGCSAAALGLTIELDPWRELTDEAVTAWDVAGEAVLRLFLTAGDEAARGGPSAGVAAIAPLPTATIAQRRGIRVATLSTGRTIDALADRPWLLGGVKTLSYATNMAAGRAAVAAGADDALLVTTDGLALEGPRAALVWRRGNRLMTTDVDGTGVLHSITQRAAFVGAAADGVNTEYGRIPVDELLGVDGAWLVSSGRLVAPILAIDGHGLAIDRAWTDRLERWVHTRLI